MLKVLYEDDEILVVIKPAGVESQAAKRFAPDMVSEVKKHLVINKSCTPGKEPYVGVIHRLDKPVSGVMVYAKTKNAAASLSKQVAEGKMHKKYLAVLCGKPVDNVGKYVDYLLKDGKTNTSRIVDKSVAGAKRAELEYQILEKKEQEEKAALDKEKKMQQAMLQIKKKFGKNAILKGMNLLDGATAKERNEQIGGHKA